MNEERWLRHFLKNIEHRTEPNWNAPIDLPPNILSPLLRSLQQFQLGDGGGPAALIAWNANRFRNRSENIRQIVDAWFREEKEHSRLLGEAVKRFGGKSITSHWSFTAFCHCRKWLGVRFELTVLLLTEISAAVYYLLLRRHCSDPAVQQMCRLIIRDETGHVAFHRDCLASEARASGRSFGRLWSLRFQMLGYAAATMLWVNHSRCIRVLGGTTGEFYREMRKGMAQFLRRLDLESRAVNVSEDCQYPAGDECEINKSFTESARNSQITAFSQQARTD